jgi:hypothetical protein
LRIPIISIVFAMLQSPLSVSAERIKRKPLDEGETARLASEQAINDDLRVGDIIATDHGFLQFRGRKQDGLPDLVPIPDPLAVGRK